MDLCAQLITNGPMLPPPGVSRWPTGRNVNPTGQQSHQQAGPWFTHLRWCLLTACGHWKVPEEQGVSEAHFPRWNEFPLLFLKEPVSSARFPRISTLHSPGQVLLRKSPSVRAFCFPVAPFSSPQISDDSFCFSEEPLMVRALWGCHPHSLWAAVGSRPSSWPRRCPLRRGTSY